MKGDLPMRRIIQAALFFLLPLLLLSGCFGSSQPPGVPLGKYEFSASTEVIKPAVTLKEDHHFFFRTSPLSSYLAQGTFTQEKEQLILTTDDEQYRFVFRVGQNQLIFSAGESTPLPSYTQIPDGAVFQRPFP